MKKISLIIILTMLLSCLPALCFSQTTDDVLDTLESAVSGNLFFAFTTLKALGDGFESGAYTKEELDEMLPLIDKILDQIQKNLEELRQNLDDSRNHFIDSAIEAFDLLKDMKNSLINYSNLKNDESYESFIKAQELAWSKIKLLLTKN